MDSGSWADWVNAVGTYLAVAGAGFAGVVALRSYRAQKAATDRQLEAYAVEDRRRLEHERQAQASTVAIWAFHGRYGWLVHGVNNSGLPVFGLTVHVFSEKPHFSVAIERGTQGPAAAGISNKLTNALQVFLEEQGASEMSPDDLSVEIAFTDCANVRWRRLADGHLAPVDGSFNFQAAEERLIDREVPIRGDRESQGIL